MELTFVKLGAAYYGMGQSMIYYIIFIGQREPSRMNCRFLYNIHIVSERE